MHYEQFLTALLRPRPYAGADADLSKLMSHMQAIELGEDGLDSEAPRLEQDLKTGRPSQAVTGLGVSMGVHGTVHMLFSLTDFESLLRVDANRSWACLVTGKRQVTTFAQSVGHLPLTANTILRNRENQDQSFPVNVRYTTP